MYGGGKTGARKSDIADEREAERIGGPARSSDQYNEGKVKRERTRTGCRSQETRGKQGRIYIVISETCVPAYLYMIVST